VLLSLLLSSLRVNPGGYACGPGPPDGGRGAGAGASQERGAALRAEPDHLGVPQLPGAPAVTAPVRRVGLDVVSGCPGGIRRCDGVGSAGQAPWTRSTPPGWGARVAARACSMTAVSSQVLLPATRRRKGWRMAGSWLWRRGASPDSCQKPRRVAGLSTGPRSGGMMLWPGRGCALAGWPNPPLPNAVHAACCAMGLELQADACA